MTMGAVRSKSGPRRTPSVTLSFAICLGIAKTSLSSIEVGDEESSVATGCLLTKSRSEEYNSACVGRAMAAFAQLADELVPRRLGEWIFLDSHAIVEHTEALQQFDVEWTI